MTNNKFVPFPRPAASPEPDPISKRHQRVIFSIGRRRLAFDFYSQVTQLNPEPAPVMPLAKGKRGKRPRSRVAARDGAAG
jgi:hypothetical protein